MKCNDTFLPQTKRELLNEIRYRTDYKLWEIERIYSREFNRIPRRNAFYAKHSAIRVLQAMLRTVRLQYGITYDEFIKTQDTTSDE